MPRRLPPQAEAVHRQAPASVRTRPRGLAQPRPAPRRLRAAARPAQPLEPILFPKLRIQFADFPYLHCSIPPEAVHLGDLLRIWVRSGMKITLAPSDFQGPTGVHRTPQETRCFTETTSLSPVDPIPGSPFLTKKRELFPGLLPVSPSSFALPLLTPRQARGPSPWPGSGILTRFPFDRGRTIARSFFRSVSERSSPIS